MTEKENEEKKEGQSAKEIAEIMAANMKANMEDPDFWDRNERIRQKVLDEVIKKRELRSKDKKE